MPDSLQVVQPRSLAEAVAALDDFGEQAKVVAGGTALSIMLRQRLIAPDALVLINRIPGLDGITVEGDTLRIGALVTHRQVEQSPLVRERLPQLAETFGKVANVRVRGVATVGGVMAEADYASDPPTMLVALSATVEALGPAGPRLIPADEFFVSFYETALEPNEVVTGIRVPLLSPQSGATYIKYITRSSEDRPCVGVAALVELAGDGCCSELRVVVGAVSERPQRLPDADAMANGQQLSERLLGEIADRYADEVHTLSDMRGSGWYRTEMIRVWVRRAIAEAAATAGSTPA